MKEAKENKRDSGKMNESLKLSTGIEISYYDSGSGRPLLFLHSFGHTKTMWLPQLNHFLQKGYRVIAPDIRGYGESTYIRANYNVTALADDIVSFVELLHIRNPVIVGISMGGYIALDIEERYPELLGALVLSNTKAEADTEEIKGRRRAQILVLEKGGVGQFVETSAPRRLSRKTLDEKPWVLDFVKMLNLSVRSEVLVSTLEAMMEKKDYTIMLPKIKKPVLITFGTEDVLIPKTAAPMMHEKISGSELVSIEGTGHVSNLENSSQYSSTLDAFLSERKT
jgi:3-oxoadipate enol-lactonase